MRFLADESCDFAVVRALRGKNFDVLVVSEYTSRSVDSELILQAHRENRILLTEDVVFHAGTPSAFTAIARIDSRSGPSYQSCREKTTGTTTMPWI